MRIALTGATGFIGQHIARQLIGSGCQLACWHRPGSDRSVLQQERDSIKWILGELGDWDSVDSLIDGCDAIVHNAFWRPGTGFRGAEGDIVEFARINILGTLNLIEKSIAAGLQRFVYVSSCAVHERILDDRPLDEAHPLWPLTHYGAHKAAIEKFVHSYGLGSGFQICALRPSGVYGIRSPIQQSKWYELVSKIVRNESVRVAGGGKEVHAADVARAIEILLHVDGIAGQSYACCDGYVSQFEVATIARELSGSRSPIIGEPSHPRHEIVTDKIRAMGMGFGSTDLLRRTIGELIES